MSLLCVADCGQQLEQVPSNYYNPCIGDIFREFGMKTAAVVSCDYQFANILDTAEWASAQAAGKAGLLPEGTILVNEPTNDTFVVDGCRREVANEAVLLLDYTTYQVDPALLDYDFWKDMFRRHVGFRLLPVDCNGIFWLSDNYAAALKGAPPVTVVGESPGLNFSMTKIPIPQLGDNGVNQVWSTQFQLKFTDVVCAGLLPGVLTTLQSGTISS